MPSIKDYNKKLASLRNTAKMTKTMKMVSASKLRRAQEAQRQAQEYERQLNLLLARLAAAVGGEGHPLLAPRPEPRRCLLLLLSSDRGLCGGFNTNLIKGARAWLAARGDAGVAVRVSFCGRRGFAALREEVAVHRQYENLHQRPQLAGASLIAHDLMRHFLDGECDEVVVGYNIFNSPLSQKPTFQKLLPIESAEFAAMAGQVEPMPARDYLFVPAREELLASLIPRTVVFKVFYAMLENAAGEHGARMTAMDNATTNAQKLIESYTLLRNRARQAAITKELIEIISGAEAI